MPECDKNGLLTVLTIEDADIDICDVTVAATKLIYSSGDFVIFACQGGYSVKGKSTAEIVAGAHYKVSGRVTLYGDKPQISANSITRIKDKNSDCAVIAAFLVDAFSGVGEKTALALANEYGKDVLNVLKNNPKEAAGKIAGLSIQRAKICSGSISESENVLKLLMELRILGLSKKQSEDAYRVMGFTAAEEIDRNPYTLLRIPGIGFDTCEKIAIEKSIDPLDVMRIVGAMQSVLMEKHMETGSTCFTPSEIKLATESILRGGAAAGMDISDALLDSAYSMAEEQAVKEKKATIFRFINNKCEGCTSNDEGARIALHTFFIIEASIKKEVANFVNASYVELDRELAIDKINDIAKSKGITPDEKQTEALLMCMSRPISIITGGPGTGKTTITGILAEHFKKEKISYEFCAPTGRAAKRLSEAAGVKANTLHRLLEVDVSEDGGTEAFCRRNRENPLEARVIVVDEASMVDVMMFRSLLYAIKSNSSIILIGDPNQLPSVGAGNLLSDLLSCKSIPRVELQYVFRQQDESSIASNAYRILQGKPLIGNDDDFVIHEVTNDAMALQKVKELFAMYHAYEDYAILCPTKQNLIGTLSLNSELQAINTSEDAISMKVKDGIVFRLGDKVMQTKNNYKLEYFDAEDLSDKTGVFNGEIGEVDDIEFLNNTCTIVFDDGKSVIYDKKSLADVDLAYAMTVHKAQGCEFDTVIIVLGKMNYKLSSRRLLYTAVTRGKNKVIIIDSDKRLNKMISNTRENARMTSLRDFMAIIDHKTGLIE